MRIETTTDKQRIKSILCHPEIYKTIAGDNGIPMNEWEPPLEGCEYLCGYVKDELIGIMVYHSKDGKLLLHIQVLPEFRKEHARKFGRIALDYGVAKNVPLYAEIPDAYPNVLSFTESFGFKKVDKREKVYLKNGEYSDMNILRYG